MTKVEIINMVANHYNDKNRSISDDESTCMYLTNDGRMCAVGMCMTDKALDTWGDFKNGVKSIVAILKDKELDSIFKDDYKGHDEDFWSELQFLHDEPYFWDECGLTLEGCDRVNFLIGKYTNK